MYSKFMQEKYYFIYRQGAGERGVHPLSDNIGIGGEAREMEDS